jgi:hypothetical protein
MMPSPRDPNPPDERVVVRIEKDSMRSLTVRSSSSTTRSNDLAIPDVWRQTPKLFLQSLFAGRLLLQ